ncbi:MAG: Tryptophan--tRNA ligase [Planctomycetes bacterium ADurb.Bin126]|nr:MAG: Tryptophan--tRNA ligase [Planctomycetes bacterium ADurb.Bin126]HOD83973.1 tryptophan--tRNA ligase [Phycisphaerae bacterium]HQL72502.1 tryptophan--tRNA ligase [Phycisphaerae bacterium]
MRILSGVQPSGKLHIGNYFGALRQYLRLQEQGHECYYFIANYHALTSVQDKAVLAEMTLDVARSYLALGIDPDRCVFFAQSDVPQVTELCWILNCVCPVSLMEKATSYKDKIAKGLTASMGLFDYPVLQAADIVIYDSNLVPVGADQKQHIEITRDLAVKLNQAVGSEVLVLPEPYIVPEVAVVPGIDGQKMSKSYNNTIEIFQTPKATQKRCAQIVTDSTPLEAPKNPEQCNVFALLKLFATPEEQQEIADKYRAGGYGYGHAKKRLAELVNETFDAARQRYEQLLQDESYVRDVLREGGKKARATAEATMQRVREAVGIVTTY